MSKQISTDGGTWISWIVCEIGDMLGDMQQIMWCCHTLDGVVQCGQRGVVDGGSEGAFLEEETRGDMRHEQEYEYEHEHDEREYEYEYEP